MANKAPMNAKATHFRGNNSFAKLDHNAHKWEYPCSNCEGKGNVKTSCCTHSECGVCFGYGCANLGEK